MNFKVKKAYYRLFSVLLSLVMIVISVPISASAELSSGDATETSEAIPSANLGKIESGEISLPINPAEMTAVTDDIITDGVYAFRNVNNPNMWLDTGYSSPLPDSYMQQYAYWTSPAATNAFFVGGLFKIKRLGSTTNPSYVIRLMTNNELIFRPNTTTGYVNSMKESPVDTEVYSANRYLLQKTAAGYIIKLLGSPYCIAAPQSNVSGEGTVASRLTYLSPTEAQTNTRAQWQLYKYEGSAKNNVTIRVCPSEMLPSSSATIWAYTSSTTIGVNGPITYTVSNANGTPTAKATIDLNTGTITSNSLGNVNVTATCAGTSYKAQKTITIADFISGTYLLENVYRNKYAQPYSNTARLLDYDREIEQRWRLERIEEDYFKIISVYSGYAMTAPSALNTDMTFRNYTGTNDQQWKFEKQDDGSFKISSRNNPSHYLSAGAMTTSDGTKLVLRTEQNISNNKWNFYMVRDASLVAVAEANNDRSSYFPSISNTLNTIGYTDVYHNNDTVQEGVTLVKFIELASSSRITLVRTHGMKSRISLTDDYLNYTKLSNYAQNDTFKHSNIMIYGACSTGEGGEYAANLVKQTVDSGVRTAIGFPHKVFSPGCNEWCQKFFELYVEYCVNSSGDLADLCDEVDSYMSENSSYYSGTADGFYISLESPLIVGSTEIPYP